ncbi:hypothetical protein BDZ94DRAFT_1251548 [Collybia nuda]|uniref:Uncharacterized protein n=1 Tax=Collybia nuda TaxID=64659 RepID=A0A9P6CHB7_9AGAR|nr:hypothetical protein BDZ94DRAFT_1251548 [Collybia nuda]
MRQGTHSSINETNLIEEAVTFAGIFLLLLLPAEAFLMLAFVLIFFAGGVDSAPSSSLPLFTTEDSVTSGALAVTEVVDVFPFV